MKIFGQYGNANTNKVLVVAEYTKQSIEFVQVQNLKDKEFLNKNPLGKCPVLETNQGLLSNSHAIVRYLSYLSNTLNGESDFEKAQIDSYLNFAAQELEPVLNQLTNPLFGQANFDAALNTRALNDARALFNTLNEQLKTRTVFVGQKISIADIVVASCLVNSFKFLFDEKFRNTFINLTRWFSFITGQNEFQSVWGKVRFCTVPLSSDCKKEEVKKDQKKDEKKKEEPKKKEEKQEITAEEAMAKQKNPLDLLPETKFNLYDFKTLMVNAPNKKDAIQFLWDNFDANGFSFWRIEYEKYPGEGEKLFMTNNLANGFLQRLEHFRKYCIGVWGVYGDEPNLEIRGLFLWRGTEKPQEILEHDSHDYHKFQKLEFSDPKTRSLVTEYWCNYQPEQKVEGLSATQVKYFK